MICGINTIFITQLFISNWATMEPNDFFENPQTIAQKQYEALRMFFVEKKSASEVAHKFGHTYRGFTTIVSHFRKKLKSADAKNLYFDDSKPGKKEME